MLQTESCDFRHYLQNELVERCRKNPSYSLRAFARSLGIGSSDLSKLLRKQRSVSEGMLIRLGERLELEPEILSSFRTLTVPGAARKRPPANNQVLVDDYYLVSDWYPFAILELSKCKNFQSDPRSIARKLGLTVSEVRIAIERLERAGYLKRALNGHLEPRPVQTTNIQQGISSSARKRQMRAVLERAIATLEDVPIEKRDHTGRIMAINSQKLPEARKLIARFRRDMSRLLEDQGKLDQVYGLTISLFPLSEEKSKRRTK